MYFSGEHSNSGSNSPFRGVSQVEFDFSKHSLTIYWRFSKKTRRGKARFDLQQPFGVHDWSVVSVYRINWSIYPIGCRHLQKWPESQSMGRSMERMFSVHYRIIYQVHETNYCVIMTQLCHTWRIFKTTSNWYRAQLTMGHMMIGFMNQLIRLKKMQCSAIIIANLFWNRMLEKHYWNLLVQINARDNDMLELGPTVLLRMKSMKFDAKLRSLAMDTRHRLIHRLQCAIRLKDLVSSILKMIHVKPRIWPKNFQKSSENYRPSSITMAASQSPFETNRAIHEAIRPILAAFGLGGMTNWIFQHQLQVKYQINFNELCCNNSLYPFSIA